MTTLIGFFTVLALVYVVPGPDFAVILRHALRGGAAGRAAALGVLSGVCVHITAALLGLSALLARSAEAFTVVKLAGAAYLLLLGAGSLYAGLRRQRDPAATGRTTTEPATTEPAVASGLEPAPASPPAVTARDEVTGSRTAVEPYRSLRRAYLQGFGSNVLNPKAVLFFVSLLPQFIDAKAPIVPQILFYGAATVLFGFAYWSLVVGVAGRIRGALARPIVRRWLDSVTGVALIGFGVRMARSQAP